jgi:integrase
VQVAGLRRGGICRLYWDDIDFETRTLRIGRSRVLVGGKIVVKESKSEHGYRTLPLEDILKVALTLPVAKRRCLVPDRLVLCAIRQLVRYLTYRTDRRLRARLSGDLRAVRRYYQSRLQPDGRSASCISIHRRA